MTGAKPLPRTLFTICFPAIRAFMLKGMRIDADSASRSLKRVFEIFQQVEAILGTRRYLVGDSFTAADMSFAALAAPLVLPPEYSIALPAIEQLPPELGKEVRALRATPAGSFALRMFRDHRRGLTA